MESTKQIKIEIRNRWTGSVVFEYTKEGVVGGIIGYYVPGIKCKDWSKESYVDTEDGRTWKLFPTPREAFASLIDKVSGRGTWDRNPWVVVYEFELVK